MTQHQIDDKKFIERPGSWPCWPHCPMKRRAGHEQEAGTIIDRQSIGNKIDPNHESLRIVFMTSIWAVGGGHAKFSEVEKKTYASIEEMLADGWQVD